MNIDPKILSKIKKCLALSTSDNPNEAATALRQAHALMAAHGVSTEQITMADIGEASAKSRTMARSKPAHWEGALRALVEEHAEATGSKWSAEVLADWDRWRTRFWQVCPKEMIGRLAHPLSDRAAEAVAAE